MNLGKAPADLGPYFPDVMAQNDRGEWMPAIPLPFYGLRKHCHCGRRFWTLGGYRGHYALAHILAMP